MTARQKVLFLLFLALIGALAVGLRVTDFPRKTLLNHDEALSYVAAAAAREALEDAVMTGGPMTGRWTTAAEWREFLDPTGASTAAIAAEMAEFDVHPPLYFIALNRALRKLGVETFIGAALNLGFFVLSLGAFAALAWLVLGRPADVLAATALWALNPHSILVSFLARPYELLALIAILTAWRALLLSDPNRKAALTDYLWIATIIAAGTLAHYQFAIPLAGAAILVAYGTMHTDPMRFARSALAVAAGLAIAYAVHPEVARIFSAYDAQIAFSGELSGPERAGLTIATLLGFFGLGHDLAGAPLILLWALAGAALVIGRKRGELGAAAAPRGGAVTLLLAVTLVGLATAYVGGVTPAHAMGPRYLSMAWPLIALAAVAGLRRLSGSSLPSYAVLLIMAATTLAHMLERESFDRALAPQTEAIGLAARIVIDTPDASVLPRLALAARADAEFFVASRPALLANPDQWLDALEPGDVIASTLFDDPDEATRSELFHLVGSAASLDRGASGFGYEIGVLRRQLD